MSSDIEHGPCDSPGEPVILGWQAEPAVFGWQARARRPRTTSLCRRPSDGECPASSDGGRTTFDSGAVLSPRHVRSNPDAPPVFGRKRRARSNPDAPSFDRWRRLRSNSDASPADGLETHNRSIVRSRKAAATRWFASESGIGRSRWAQPTTGPARTLACRARHCRGHPAALVERRCQRGRVTFTDLMPDVPPPGLPGNGTRPVVRLAGGWAMPGGPATGHR